jgi:hypothetical protein
MRCFSLQCASNVRCEDVFISHRFENVGCDLFAIFDVSFCSPFFLLSSRSSGNWLAWSVSERRIRGGARSVGGVSSAR